MQVSRNLERLLEQYQDWGVSSLVFIVTLILVYLVTSFVVIPPIIKTLERRNRNNPTLVNAIEKYIKVIVIVIALPIAMTAAGLGGILSGTSVVFAALTIAVGFAAQDTLGNLVSGLFLVADPDFNVGDYIAWNDQEGKIKSFDIRVTRIRTVADETIVVPNTELTTNSVRSPYAANRYRVTQKVQISYHDDVEEVSNIIKEIASEDDRIRDKPRVKVSATNLGDTAIELTVHFWISNPSNRDILDIRSDFNSRVKDRLLSKGVSVAPATPFDLSGELDVKQK